MRRLMLAVMGGILLAGCTGTQSEQTSPVESTVLPRSVSTLVARDNLTVFLRVLINDRLLEDRILVEGDNVSVSVAASQVAQSVNELSVNFYVPKYGSFSSELSLASSQQLLSLNEDDSVASLSGRLYRYADSDDDGIFNVHELAINPRDLDGDMVENVFDSDSDGDGIVDGSDEEPYEGSDSAASIIDLQQTLRLEIGGATLAVAVEQLRGDGQELLQAANTLSSLPLRTPSFWPASATKEELANRYWTAYGLKAGAQELCPDWRQSVGTSSIRSSVQGTVLLYFRRDDGEPFITAVGDDDIVDLDLPDNDFPGNSQGPLNDGLRMILVPRGTVGWLELYTDTDFEGRACSLNVTSRRAAVFPRRN